MIVNEFHRLAAIDNGEWCSAVWRAHGLPVEAKHGLVACRGAPPRFYPNAVTVDPGADPAAQLDWLEALARQAPPGDFFVKDSFQTLDCGALAYERLFDASWIRRPADKPSARAHLAWRTITKPQALRDWELAWNGGDADLAPIFLPGLLAEPSVRILAGSSGHAIAAGCVLSVTGEVVGVSNVFGDQAEAFSAAAEAAAGRDLVGYENGEDLPGALAAGFEAVGGLAVWVRRAQ